MMESPNSEAPALMGGGVFAYNQPMEKYVFKGTPDEIFPYERGTVCHVSLRRVLVSVTATIVTPDFKTVVIPYSSKKAFLENWEICGT